MVSVGITLLINEQQSNQVALCLHLDVQGFSVIIFKGHLSDVPWCCLYGQYPWQRRTGLPTWLIKITYWFHKPTAMRQRGQLLIWPMIQLGVLAFQAYTDGTTNSSRLLIVEATQRRRKSTHYHRTDFDLRKVTCSVKSVSNVVWPNAFFFFFKIQLNSSECRFQATVVN